MHLFTYFFCNSKKKFLQMFLYCQEICLHRKNISWSAKNISLSSNRFFRFSTPWLPIQPLLHLKWIAYMQKGIFFIIEHLIIVTIATTGILEVVYFFQAGTIAPACDTICACDNETITKAKFGLLSKELAWVITMNVWVWNHWCHIQKPSVYSLSLNSTRQV